MNPPVGQNPQTLCPQHSHLQAAWHCHKGLQRALAMRSPQQTTPSHQSTPGVGSTSQSPIPVPGLSPTCPPRAPQAVLATPGVPTLPEGARSGVSAGASAAPHGRGTSGAAAGSRDSWADRATLKIAEECEGPAGAAAAGGRAGGGHAGSGASPPPPSPPPLPEEVMWAPPRGELPGLRPPPARSEWERHPQAKCSCGAGGAREDSVPQGMGLHTPVPRGAWCRSWVPGVVPGSATLTLLVSPLAFP